MHTYPVDKPGYILFQDAPSVVNYACERINEYTCTYETGMIKI